MKNNSFDLKTLDTKKPGFSVIQCADPHDHNNSVSQVGETTDNIEESCATFSLRALDSAEPLKQHIRLITAQKAVLSLLKLFCFILLQIFLLKFVDLTSWNDQVALLFYFLCSIIFARTKEYWSVFLTEIRVSLLCFYFVWLENQEDMVKYFIVFTSFQE